MFSRLQIYSTITSLLFNLFIIPSLSQTFTCPYGSYQMGTTSINNDIDGCGLTSCAEGHYGHNYVFECYQLCKNTPDCTAFEYNYKASGHRCLMNAGGIPNADYGILYIIS